MARRAITLDEKIEKAEAAVLAAKVKYDAALDELEKLVTKRKELNDKKLLEAYHSSNKSFDENLKYLVEEGVVEKAGEKYYVCD